MAPRERHSASSDPIPVRALSCRQIRNRFLPLDHAILQARFQRRGSIIVWRGIRGHAHRHRSGDQGDEQKFSQDTLLVLVADLGLFKAAYGCRRPVQTTSLTERFVGMVYLG